MMNMLRPLWIFCLILFLVPLPVSAVDVADDPETVPYLFTLAGMSGTLEGDQLTLNDVPLVVYFADRPARKAGSMSLQRFIKMWDRGENNFKQGPPSAELDIYEKSGDKQTILILEKPEVRGNKIAFKVKAIDGTVPDSFGHATIFMDSLGVKKSPS